MPDRNFVIRTITAGVNLQNLASIEELIKIHQFLKEAKKTYEGKGYFVQTIRIATNHFHEIWREQEWMKSIELLKIIDEFAVENQIMISIGQVLLPNVYDQKILNWATQLIERTTNISFSIPISQFGRGILPSSIKVAAEIMVAISQHSPNGEGNFNFAAAANCQPDIPYFPVAYHQGNPLFAIGLEYPNVLTRLIENVPKDLLQENIQAGLEEIMLPVENIALDLSENYQLKYSGIDTSTAPGLKASVGKSIEVITGMPFGSASTLQACSLITDTIKNLNVKTCGYCGLMLPVLEDEILAKRAIENRFSIQELLLYSAVSGTGLDVVPIAGNTSVKKIESLLSDVAALSTKYVDKPLSARLLLIPGKNEGDLVDFENPYLTSSRIMKID